MGHCFYYKNSTRVDYHDDFYNILRKYNGTYLHGLQEKVWKLWPIALKELAKFSCLNHLDIFVDVLNLPKQILNPVHNDYNNTAT